MIQINGKDVSQIRVGNKIITAVYMKAGKTNKFLNYALQKNN